MTRKDQLLKKLTNTEASNDTDPPLAVDDALQQDDNLPEIFHQLIPAHSIVGEEYTKLSSSYLRSRYDSAAAMRTGNPTPTKEELKRFQENCGIIGAVKIGIELRNYLLWEVYSTEQFRESDQDFESFGQRLTGLSAAQLRKAVHSGRIMITMIKANLDEVAPTGRQVEELSKIESEHTLKAWLHALEYMRIHGKSGSMLKEALLDYCRKEGIKFGRRMPNGSRLLGLPKIASNRKANKKDVASSNEPNPLEDSWHLSQSEEQIFHELIPSSGKTDDSTSQKEHVFHCITALRTVASRTASNEYTSSQMQALLSLVARKEGETARALMNTLYLDLRKLIMHEIPPREVLDTQPMQKKASKQNPAVD
ncbi:MAG: hypothetical protein ACSHX9_01600 [Luteolibacter sp.]